MVITKAVVGNVGAAPTDKKSAKSGLHKVSTTKSVESVNGARFQALPRAAMEKGPAADVGASATDTKPAKSGLHKQLRKTKFCMFHLQGACQFGKDCAFAHSLSEMNGMPDLRKTQICKNFAEGHCKDKDCNFAHGEAELRSTDMFFKKSLCIWYEKGKCRNASQCRFAHGLTELRLNQEKQQAYQKSQQDAKKVADAWDSQPQDVWHDDASTDVGSTTLSSIPSAKSSHGRKGDKQIPPWRVASRQDSIDDISSNDGGSSNDLSEPTPEPTTLPPGFKPPPGLDTPPPERKAAMQKVAEWEEEHRTSLQEKLMQRLGDLEAQYKSIETARQESADTNGSGDLWTDLGNLGKDIAKLAEQCNKMQKSLKTLAANNALPAPPPGFTAGPPGLALTDRLIEDLAPQKKVTQPKVTEPKTNSGQPSQESQPELASCKASKPVTDKWVPNWDMFADSSDSD